MTLSHLKLLLFALVGLIGLLIGWGVATAVSPTFAILTTLFTGLWLFWLAQNGRRWPAAPDGLAALLGGLAAWALLSDPPNGWPLYLGLMGLLVGWDLSLFNGRLHDPDAHVPDIPGLIRARGGRLLLLVLLSLLAVLLVRWLTLPFQFDWTLLLAVLLIIGLRYLTGRTLADTP